jgi:hypothetical protein
LLKLSEIRIGTNNLEVMNVTDVGELAPALYQMKFYIDHLMAETYLKKAKEPRVVWSLNSGLDSTTPMAYNNDR